MRDQGISLVTGGLGFIGRYLVKALIDRGKKVRVLDKDPSTGVFTNAVEVVTGSVLDKSLLSEIMPGVSFVYHLAGIPHLWQQNPKDFARVNVNGTRNILEAASNSGIRRLVYTSSETILRPWKIRSDRPIDETNPLPSVEELPGPYSKSKLLAELEVMKAVSQGFPATVVYPTIPVGAGDINLTPPTRMIRDFLNGKSPAYLECNLNLIPVQAVAEGHILAAENGKVGERYILGQENMKMSELLRQLELLTGKKMPVKKVPYQMAMLTARAMEFSARLSGKAPAASVEGVRLAGANMIFKTSKAREELGLHEYPIQQALKQSIDWLE
ncbi:MAG: dihydroflavonol-4-reductase [Cyclobacteriaceae bacterium]|nr:MAG: dihydroflavonol-4-reductase [Cyclobacteriaceae bacterium]